MSFSFWYICTLQHVFHSQHQTEVDQLREASMQQEADPTMCLHIRSAVTVRTTHTHTHLNPLITGQTVRHYPYYHYPHMHLIVQ